MKHGNINFDWEPYRMRAIPVGYGRSKLGVWVQ
jgi:hypothetical protein